MSIIVNTEIIKRYRNYGLSLDYLGSVIFLLLALYEEDYDLLDAFDDGNKERRVLLIYQTLYRKGFLECNDDETIYNLTEKGIDFIKYIKSFDDGNTNGSSDRVTSGFDKVSSRGINESLEGNQQSVTATGQSGEDQSQEVRGEEPRSSSEDVSTWIEAWINLFPKEKMQGRYLRTNKHECADRMRWFMKEYAYDMPTIFKATKLYIESQETSPQGHTFTRNSSYFIFKGRTKADRTSDLATWCQRVLDSGNEEKEYIERDVI